MKANELINKWGMAKYGTNYNLPDGTKFSLVVEGRDSGYCETCSSPYSAVVVYAEIPVPAVLKTKTRSTSKEVDELRDVEIHTLLNEILAVL